MVRGRAWLFRQLHCKYPCTTPVSVEYNAHIISTHFPPFFQIPLARKLQDCGVFGVSSDEYLDYAVKNRKEWELRGKEIVSEMVESMDDVFVVRAASTLSSSSRPTLVPQPSTRSLALKSSSMHTPASPVKRAIRFVAMNKQMSTDDLMEFMYEDHRKSEKRRSMGSIEDDRRNGEKRNSMGARLEL